ncbi:HlyD family type I secretion periplasmic adaptor subunit [Sphaerotilus sp.]|uniref:HlyD family type I secretion periplasmic adaptor subunit n=1 Tax=Sphaerotilus sp. TaxID=2093942 RepID=UPI0034E1A929
MKTSTAAVPSAGRFVRGDEQFLTGTRQASLVEPTPHALWAIYLLCLIVVAAGVWASLSPVDVITRAQGKVVPDGQEQVIASLEGGLLRAVLVHEGDLVEVGADLVQLDPTRVAAQQNEGRAHQLSLIGTAARLSAEANGRAALNVPAELRAAGGAGAAIVAAEMDALQARRRVLEDSVSASRSNIALLEQELATARQMAERGLMSEVEVMRLDRQRNELLMQVQERLNRFRQEASTDLVRVNGELAQLAPQQVAKVDAVQRTTLKSPVRGIVKNVRMTTVGGVVGAGAPIMEIVPQGDRVLVEARIPPADIGFVHAGLPVTVKLSTYDFYTYGGLEGTIEVISPDALGEERPGSTQDTTYYKARIRADASRLHTATGHPLAVLPGMTATVEIRTGERSVLEFLVSPMLKGREAFRER